MSDAHDYPDDSDDNCDSESLREWQSSFIMDNKRPMDNMALAWDTPQEDELATNMMSSGVSPYMPLLFPRKEKSFRKFYRFRTGTGEK